MKRYLLFQLIAIIFVSLVIIGCNRTAKQPQSTLSGEKESTVLTEGLDTVKMKAQLIELIQTFPNGLEIADFLKEAGASFIPDLTVPPEAVEKMLTTTQKAFGSGMISFDGKYAAVFKRGDIVLQIRTNMNKMNTEMGLDLGYGLIRDVASRFERNKSNIDSLMILANMMQKSYDQYIRKGEHPSIYSMQFIGAHIEALHVLTQLTLLANHKEKLLAVMNGQNERIKILTAVLETISSDESVRPYYESIAPVLEFLAERSTITEADLNIIAPVIIKARKSILP